MKMGILERIVMISSKIFMPPWILMVDIGNLHHGHDFAQVPAISYWSALMITTPLMVFLAYALYRTFESEEN